MMYYKNIKHLQTNAQWYKFWCRYFDFSSVTFDKYFFKFLHCSIKVRTTKSKSTKYPSYDKLEYHISLYAYLNNSVMAIESNVYWRNWVVKLVHAFSIFFSAFKFSQLRFSLPHMMRDGNPFESVRRSGINVHLITTKNCIQNKIENR